MTYGTMYTRQTAPSGNLEAKTWWVYTLSDSRAPKITRYVGITYRPKARLAAHINLARNGCKTHKGCWIRSVVSAGGEILLSLIAGGLTVEKAKEIEILEISRLKAAGLDLTNGTSGGDGVTGLAPEIRDKISKVWVGRKHTPEARSKMSASKMGQVQSRETVEKRTAKNRGQKRPPEFSVKMSAIASGRPGRKHTDESRAKMSATRTGLKRLPYSHAAIENFSRSRRMLAPKSGFKGVGKKMKKGKWEACIEAGGKYAYLGRFESAESAARAYDRAAIETWGAGNCYLNFPVLKESQ